MISKVKEVCNFFNHSPTRNSFLSAVIKDQYPENARKKPLVTLRTTRWAERSQAYQHFYESFEYVVYVLEVMAHNLHHHDCPAQFYGCWNTGTKRDASGLLQDITNFEFVMTFVIGYLYLSHMSALTMKLQRKSNDIFKAFTMVSSVLKSHQDMDEMYDDAYEKAMAMAAKVGVAPTAPRVAGRQRHHDNAPAPTAKEYYRISVAAPFLDHIILQLGECFDAVTSVIAVIRRLF